VPSFLATKNRLLPDAGCNAARNEVMPTEAIGVGGKPLLRKTFAMTIFHNIYKLQKHVLLRHQSYLIVFMGINKNLRLWQIMPL
jgi:hypothetical protein